jgi:hypothetical protein
MILHPSIRHLQETHCGEYLRLHELLVAEAERSHLPEEPTARAALHDLLLRIRLAPAPVAA